MSVCPGKNCEFYGSWLILPLAFRDFTLSCHVLTDTGTLIEKSPQVRATTPKFHIYVIAPRQFTPLADY
jgi:hypothetical protein